jgi:cytochrome c-type biogenesis protein CcmH/NrfF
MQAKKKKEERKSFHEICSVLLRCTLTQNKSLSLSSTRAAASSMAVGQ